MNAHMPPDPAFPNRPTHPDYGFLSTALLHQDATVDRGETIDQSMGALIDGPSAAYAAQQRALMGLEAMEGWQSRPQQAFQTMWLDGLMGGILMERLRAADTRVSAVQSEMAPSMEPGDLEGFRVVGVVHLEAPGRPAGGANVGATYLPPLQVHVRIGPGVGFEASVSGEGWGDLAPPSHVLGLAPKTVAVALRADGFAAPAAEHEFHSNTSKNVSPETYPERDHTDAPSGRWTVERSKPLMGGDDEWYVALVKGDVMCRCEQEGSAWLIAKLLNDHEARIGYGS